MKAPPHPDNEEQRLSALRSLNLIDTPREERFDRLCRIASQVFRVPIAFLALVDTNRQWFKSCIGLEVDETPRDISFCGHTILEKDALIISDARQDPRFADNPLVTGPPYIRFYAGHVLRGPANQKVGTFCLVDDQPRPFAAAERRLLTDLAAVVERELNLTEMAALQGQLLEAREEADRLLRSILPGPVADRLRQSNDPIADHFPEATVLVAMVHDFTGLTRHLEAKQEVELLNRIFCGFDELATRHGVEKIKTLEASYMAATGLPRPQPDHLEAMANFALAMQEQMVRLDPHGRQNLQLRIGLDTGPVVAGVIGKTKFSYDIWSHTVDAALEMAVLGAPGCIQVNDTVHERLRDRYIFELRGEYYLKSKGAFKLHFLKGMRHTGSQGAGGNTGP